MKIDEADAFAINVGDVKAAELPNTGGAGMAAGIGALVLLLLGAGGFVLWRRRHGGDQA